MVSSLRKLRQIFKISGKKVYIHTKTKRRQILRRKRSRNCSLSGEATTDI